MNSEQCMIEALKAMGRAGITTLEIYYAEIIKDPKIWSVDVMNNTLNDVCEMAWTWTVMSAEEDRAYREEFEDDSPLDDYEIVVHDEDFSDATVCRAIESWLVVNDLDHLGFNVKMIKFEDAVPYSGYVKDLMERDIEEELKNAVPLEDIMDLKL